MWREREKDRDEKTTHRESARQRTNERTIFFINEGKGISTILFFTERERLKFQAIIVMRCSLRRSCMLIVTV